MNIRRLHSAAPEFARELDALTGIDAQAVDVDAVVTEIVASVKARGDAALVELTNRLDGAACRNIDDLVLDADEFRRAFRRPAGRAAFGAGDRRRAHRALPPATDSGFLELRR